MQVAQELSYLLFLSMIVVLRDDDGYARRRGSFDDNGWRYNCEWLFLNRMTFICWNEWNFIVGVGSGTLVGGCGQ